VLKWLGHEVDYWPSFTAKVKIMWSCTFTRYIFMAWYVISNGDSYMAWYFVKHRDSLTLILCFYIEKIFLFLAGGNICSSSFMPSVYPVGFHDLCVFVPRNISTSYLIFTPKLILSILLASQLAHSMEQSLFEKLIVTQLVKKFSSFRGIQRFSTLFRRTHHWT
jgi:hypothetical protein